MTNTPATDVVTFALKGTGVCCVVCGTFIAGIHVESTDINIKRTELYSLSILLLTPLGLPMVPVGLPMVPLVQTFLPMVTFAPMVLLATEKRSGFFG